MAVDNKLLDEKEGCACAPLTDYKQHGSDHLVARYLQVRKRTLRASAYE